MLDKMRRNVRRLSWTLWLVIVAFVVLYFPDILRGGAPNAVARVDGEPILISEYQRMLNEQLNLYRSMNQGELTEELIQQLQLQNIVLEQLIRRKLILVAAHDQGFAIGRQEIKDRMMTYPVFTTDTGEWVGDEQYRSILRRNGLEPLVFEQSVIDDLLVERVTNLITEGVAVSEAEVQDLFQRQNERVRFEYVQVRPTAFEFEVDQEITDAEVRAHYDADPDVYRLPEQRRVSYAVVDTEHLRDSIAIAEEELRAEYEATIADFTSGEQIKARQILLRLPPTVSEEAKAGIRARAEAVVERLAAGEDFADLARELSDDPSSATGGDLGWVTRGLQVEGFDEVAFGLQPGETSGVVETPMGFHVIRVDEYREAAVQPFEEVRGQIEQRLAWDRAEAQAEATAGAIRREALRGNSLEEIAEAHGLTVESSPLFGEDEGFGVYTSVEFTGRAFSLGRGRVAEPLRVRQGHMVFRVDEIVAPHTPEFEVVTDRVRSDLVDERAVERAGERAREFVGRLASGESLQAIADEAAAVVDSTDLITRDDFVPALGRAPELIQAAFERAVGESGGPIEVSERLVLFRIVEHQQPDWSLFAAQSEGIREQEKTERRNRLFEAYVESLRNVYSVSIYNDVLEQIPS